MGATCSQQDFICNKGASAELDVAEKASRSAYEELPIVYEVLPGKVAVGDVVQAWLHMAPAPGTACHKTLHDHFPGALPGSLAKQRIIAATDKYGLTPENTVYGHSLCPDEINHEKGGLSYNMTEHWGKCFPMGGIGGAPYVGKTGFMAFSHHVPDDGHVLILFGPHIAISDEGEAGKCLRDGQGKLSGACGAALAAYDSCCKGQNETEFEAKDMQQWWLRQQVQQKLDKIKSADHQLKALVNVAYESVQEKLLSISNNDFGNGHLVLVGGIQINMPRPFEDHFQPLFFKVMKKDGSSDDLLSSMAEPNAGYMGSGPAEIKTSIQRYLSWANLTPPPESPCSVTMQSNFPGALPGALLVKRLATILEPFGLTPANTIYGESVCPDEINHEKGGMPHTMAEYWGKCFPMGGIGGAPYVGQTGFHAFSHHVPDNGHVLILFGPHISISSEGELGKILRAGQAKKSGACGAVLAAYDSCCKGNTGDFDPADMQQWWLREKVGKDLMKIKDSAVPLQGLINVAFESVKEKLLSIVNHNFGDGHLVLVGGIQINLEKPYRDHFFPMHFEVRTKSGEQHDMLSSLREVQLAGSSVPMM